MPRANRYFASNRVWHITHRCHKREFLLKFERDRQRWRYWLYQARERYGLCVLNYIVTSNHIHLLVKDRGHGEITKSVQLIAGRTAQEYNQRKRRAGAFWQDRYHATAVDTDGHLGRCMLYIDMNMIRAGAINHPSQWKISGYNEIQRPPERYRVIDQQVLMELFGVSLSQLQNSCRQAVLDSIEAGQQRRDSVWTESIAVGNRQFVDDIKAELGIKAAYRTIIHTGSASVLKEPEGNYCVDFYDKIDVLSSI